MISNLILPLIILITFIYSYKKIIIYDEFIDGSLESLKIIKDIFPNLLAMFLAINIFINSGILDYIVKIFPFPNEEIMMILLRPISGSTSLVLLDNIYTKYGPDSKIGLLSSVIQSSSETTFYVISLYFGSIGIKKTKYALYESLLCDLIGIILSIIIVSIVLIK